MTELTAIYQTFVNEIRTVFEKQAVITDYSRRYAYGTDASFYRKVPQIVLVVSNVKQVQFVLKVANRLGLPVTFRAAGTSLSGQAVTDSILVLLSLDWNQITPESNGLFARMSPAIIGEKANQALASFGRKIGPDPASIGSCQIGGIVANNASGMCCGVKNNTYHTLQDMVIVFANGLVLDTSNIESRTAFRHNNPEFIQQLTNLIVQVQSDENLVNQIKHKYRLKNTTGYGLNALVDFVDPIDVIKHLIVGSEGTLGFIAEVTLKTVIHDEFRETGFLVFDDIAVACHFVSALQQQDIEAAELLDKASLKALQHHPLLSNIISSEQGNVAAILIEISASNEALLVEKRAAVLETLSTFETAVISTIPFTADTETAQQLWQIRKGTFPAVGANRKPGTTVIIEDVSFPVERLAEGIMALQSLFTQFNYQEAIIFGHALVGNIHFVFTQAFDNQSEIDRYDRFMKAVADLVVNDFDGALKAEHGTGRNMAAFVEMEWGSQAYQIMKTIKQLFDPNNILNPGVILNEDPLSHLRDLKAMPAVDHEIDNCIECGFCESVCPTHGLTLSPRQRIALQRHATEISQKLQEKKSGERVENLSLDALNSDFQTLGIDSCAATGMCQQKCPVTINTGDYILKLRAERSDVDNASIWSKHFGVATDIARWSLTTVAAAKSILGESTMAKISRGAHAFTKGHIPPHFPNMARAAKPLLMSNGHSCETRETVLYFPACASRMIGQSDQVDDRRDLNEVIYSLLEKANFNVELPENVKSLCCGLPWQSKGQTGIADSKSAELFNALSSVKNAPDFIITDTSPCSRRLSAQTMPKSMTVLDISSFVAKHVLPRLNISPINEPIIIHPTCSNHFLGNEDDLFVIAQACSREKPHLTEIACCGFAGDKGFNMPEINRHSLRHLKRKIPSGCRQGYSTSRTCELGLTRHSGIQFQSIFYLLDQVSQAQQ